MSLDRRTGPAGRCCSPLARTVAGHGEPQPRLHCQDVLIGELPPCFPAAVEAGKQGFVLMHGKCSGRTISWASFRSAGTPNSPAWDSMSAVTLSPAVLMMKNAASPMTNTTARIVLVIRFTDAPKPSFTTATAAADSDLRATPPLKSLLCLPQRPRHQRSRRPQCAQRCAGTPG